MKRIGWFALSFVTICTVARAQVESLLDRGNWGAWIKPAVSLTRIESETAELGTVGIGVALNRTFYLGWGYTTLLSDIRYGSPQVGELDAFDFWYTGAMLGYSLRSSQLVHAAFELLIGAGRITAGLTSGGGDKERVLIGEPAVAVLVNVSPTVELGLELAWRLVDTSGVEGLGAGDLGGLRGGLILRCTESR
ncbi:MAG: hypothetical protein ACUVWX_06025 [Kiritimatiellia bacterium]